MPAVGGTDLRGVRGGSAFRLESCPCGGVVMIMLDQADRPLCFLHLDLAVGVDIANTILTHQEKVAAVAKYGTCGHG